MLQSAARGRGHDETREKTTSVAPQTPFPPHTEAKPKLFSSPAGPVLAPPAPQVPPDLMKLRCTPRARCAPEQSMQRKTP